MELQGFMAKLFAVSGIPKQVVERRSEGWNQQGCTLLCNESPPLGLGRILST
jgi:hypothetical protein